MSKPKKKPAWPTSLMVHDIDGQPVGRIPGVGHPGRTGRVHVPPDFKKLTVETGVAYRTAANPPSAWYPLLQMLQEPGQSVKLELHYKETICSFLRKSVLAGLIADDWRAAVWMDQEGQKWVRVWRLTDEDRKRIQPYGVRPGERAKP
jgi:hypothetical protein